MPYKEWNDEQVAEWTTDPSKGDKFNWTSKGGQVYYPIWKGSLTGQVSTLGQQASAVDPNKTAGGFTGVDYNYFNDLLKKMMSEGDPNQQLYRQNIQGGIDKSFNNQQRTLKQNLAQTGNFRSGAGTQAMADIEAGRSGAVGQAEVALAGQDQSFRSNALKNLLGLQSLGLQEMGQNRNYSLSLQEMIANLVNSQKQYDMASDPDAAWGDILGQLITAGGMAAGSDKKLKENIKEVGETESGLPIVEFNYKGSPIKFKGHLAHQVQKKFPDAVFKMIDYSKLPEDAVFQVVN